MDWYYTENGKAVGPLTEEQFLALVNSGRITGDSLVWRQDMKEWAPYATVAPAAAHSASRKAASETAPCAQCGRLFSIGEMVPYEGVHVCAECKPAFFQRVQEGANLPGVFQYGGFWIRVGAKIIDAIILGVVNQLFTMVFRALGLVTNSPSQPFSKQMGAMAVLTVVQLIIGASYATFFLGRFGATPGKMACKLKVVRADGSPISYARALGRHFAEMLSMLILYIGYIMVAFDEEKRALHDRICDTRVIKTS